METMMDDELLIPQAEELEWLEANSFLPEFEEEDNFSINEEVTGENNADIPALAESDHHSQESGVTRKRVWTEENVGSEIFEEFVPNEENRCKRRSLGLVEGDQNEDWLHYSPRKPTVVHTVSEIDDLMAEDSVQEKILSKFAVEIEGDFIPVTGPNGDRVYAKIQSSKITDGGPKKFRIEKYNDVTDVAGLLSEPIDIILQKLDDKAFLKDFEEKEHSPCHLAHSEVSSFSEKLWVEKYAPCFFTELLSDEQTNKEVLLWLKQWDSSIFGSQVRLTTDDVLSALRRHSSAVQHGKYSDSKSFGRGKVVPFRYQNMNSCNVPDEKSEKVNIYSESFTKKATVDHPLEYKVLLLCGPPGLGKTTLAHVAAKHCGYRVIEINASDDRSSSTLESKIIDVVQMTSVTSDAKPKCLVIDEIDGALGEGKGAVEVILKLVAADKKANFEKSNSTERSISEKHTSRKGQKSASLLRPIICICNDLYAPALRPLRQIAKVHMFVKPTISRVVNRLKYICNKEGLKTNSIALAALAEFTECDIRSCLNTLQFLHKKKEILNILDVGSQVVGHKDITSSCFDIWKQIFQNGKSKRKNSSTFNLCGHKDFEFMYSLLSNRGDYDLTMDAIQENFLKVSYIDPLMKKTVGCLNLLGVSDLLHQFVMRTQQMFLHAYQPSLAITIRHLIAHVEKPIIEWPKSIQRCRTMSIERKDLLKLWQNKISPVFARHLSIEYFTEDFVSLFLHILVPPTLRPVALHLLSEKEKDDLAQLVDTMVSYSITYKSSKAENLKGPQRHGIANDVPILALDPPICDFVNFKDYQPAHLGLSQAMKQVLLQEVEKQRILRENSGKSLNLSDEQSKQRQASVVVKTEALHGAITNKSSLIDGSMTKLNLSNKGNNRSIPAEAPAGSKLPANNPASFFDRFRQRCSIDSKNNIDTNLKKASTAERDHRPFLFKYNEGFTNAVKRSVKVRELLL